MPSEINILGDTQCGIHMDIIGLTDIQCEEECAIATINRNGIKTVSNDTALIREIGTPMPSETIGLIRAK